MTKTMEEMIEATTVIESELSGGDGTHAEIAAAVERACPGWPADDRRAAVTLAAHIMHRAGDEGWNVAELRKAGDDVEHSLRYAMHLCDLSGDLQIYLKQIPAQPLGSRIEDICDRYVTYPVPVGYRKPHWGSPFAWAMAEHTDLMTATICEAVESGVEDPASRAEKWNQALERPDLRPLVEDVLRRLAAERCTA